MKCEIKDGRYICVRYKYRIPDSDGKGSEERVVDAKSSGTRIQRQRSGSGKNVLVC